MTKTTFFRWLKRTSPPRLIRRHQWMVAQQGYIDCWVARYQHTGCGDARHSGVIVLVSPKSEESAERHALKYKRWLREFEQREAAEAAGGDDG